MTRELVALLELPSSCYVFVSALWLSLTMPWVVLRSVIVAIPSLPYSLTLCWIKVHTLRVNIHDFL